MKKHRGVTESDIKVEFDASLPPHLRSRLYDLFGSIEKEFELLYSENLELREKLDSVASGTDRLDISGDVADAGIKPGVKKSGSQISQRIKSTYRTGTTKIVSSFKPQATSASHVTRAFEGHGDGVWEVSVGSLGGVRVIGTASAGVLVADCYRADKTARLYHLESGTCLHLYRGHTGSVNSIRFHPTEPLVVTGAGDGACHVWRLNESWIDMVSDDTGDELNADPDQDALADLSQSAISVSQSASLALAGHASAVVAVDWLTPDRLVSGSWDRRALVWDANTGQLVESLKEHDDQLTNVSTHVGHKLLLTASVDASFRLWDFRDAADPLKIFLGHAARVSTATFVGEDKIVSGSDDRSVKLWDLRQMSTPITTLKTDSSVNRLAVRGNVIAIPQDNRQIRLFRTDGTRLGRLPRSNRQGHARMATSVAWIEPHRDSCNLVSAGFDRKVLAWHVTWSAVVNTSSLVTPAAAAAKMSSSASIH